MLGNQTSWPGVNPGKVQLDQATADRLAAMPSGLVWALHWANLGWPVFPVVPGRKEPLTEHGVLDASQDPAQIRAWWRRWPDANIGGATAGRIVIDPDSYKPEFEAEMRGLIADGLELPPTRTHAARGTHLVYRDTTGLDPKQIRGGLASSVDVKHGPGQYVVLPPSVHPDGKRYRISRGVGEAAVPDGLRTFLEKPPGPDPMESVPEARPLPPTLPPRIRQALDRPPGDRNVHTFNVMCQAVRCGLDDGEVVSVLELDETTRQRWDEKPHKRFVDITSGLPRAKELALKEDDEGEKASTAMQLIAMAKRDFIIGRMTGGVPFAARRDGPNVAKAFRGDRNSLRSYLAHSFVQENGRTANQNALSEAVQALDGLAEEMPVVELPMRSAEYEGELVLDLGTEDGRAVVVGPGGWKVADRSPVLFRRTELTGELPVPVKGGSLREHLFPFINLPGADDQALVTAVMISWLWPDIAHPALYFRGEEGTAKSTAAKLLRRLFDPSPAELRRQPGRDEDFEISIYGQSLVVLDNLSSISEWLSDAICTAITKTADIKRRKYADQDLSVTLVRRSFILTSIPPLLDRGDLVDRTIPFELLPIESRKTDTEIGQAWEAAWPLALGALLDLASKVMATMRDVEAAGAHRDYRMADFALIAAAFDQAAGTRALPRYAHKVADSVSSALEADPFSAAIMELVERKPWAGSVAELHNRIVERHLSTPTAGAWPKSPTATGMKLRRISGSLRKAGVSVTHEKGRKAKLVRIQRTGGE